jgi:hypothetical protein
MAQIDGNDKLSNPGKTAATPRRRFPVRKETGTYSRGPSRLEIKLGKKGSVTAEGGGVLAVVVLALMLVIVYYFKVL